jgi:hypothetical protein
MDERIAQIVENNPPPPDGKGRYMYRRYGKIDEDDELKADDDGLVEMDEEERRDSATDNEDSPVQIKRNAQRQEEEEEEEEDGEGQAVMHRPEASSNLRSQGAKRQEAEITEEQAGEQQPEVGRTRSTRRRSRVSLGDALGPKRRRTVSHRSLLCPRFLSDRLTLKRLFRSVHHRLLWRNLGSLMISMRHYEVIPSLTMTSPLKNPYLVLHPLTRRKSGRARRSGRRLELGEWCPRFHPAERGLVRACYQSNLKLCLLLRALPQGQKQKQKLLLPPQRRSPFRNRKFSTSL